MKYALIAGLMLLVVWVVLPTTRPAQDEAIVHPPEMRCFPPRDMLDWREIDPPPGLCPDWHHLDV
jgi:hypothetical protein